MIGLCWIRGGGPSLALDPDMPMIDPGSGILHVQKRGTIWDRFARASGATTSRRRPIGGGN